MRLCRLAAKQRNGLQQMLLFGIGVVLTFLLQQWLDFRTPAGSGLALASEAPTVVSARSPDRLDRLPIKATVPTAAAPTSLPPLPQNLLENPTGNPLENPLENSPQPLLQPSLQPAEPEQVVTNNTISQAGLTLPSLWWAQQQFGGNLLESWRAFNGTVGRSRRVELVVNQQIWNQQSYIQRYTFINQMGSSAREFGFSTRILNAQGDVLAAYACEFPQLSPSPVQQASAASSDMGSNGTIDMPTPVGTGQSASVRTDAQGLPLAEPTTATTALSTQAAACTVSLDSSGAGSLSGTTTDWFDATPAIGGGSLRSR